MLIKRRKIGVAMSLYNQAQYVEESLDSLLDQTVRPHSIVVVDDGSTDDSYERLERYERFGVKKWRLNRAGVSAVLNRAVQMLDTEFIAIQAADDASNAERLEWQRDVYLAERPQAVFSLPTVIDQESRIMPDSYANEFFRESPYINSLQRLFLSNNYLCASSAFLRRKDFFAAGGFHPGILHLQDFLLWLRLAHRGELRVIPDRLVRYRRNSEGGNLSSPANDIRMRAELSYIYSKFFEGCSEHRIQQCFPELKDSRVADGRGGIVSLYMLHGDPIIKQVGLEMIWSATDLLFDKAGANQQLIEHFQGRFTESDIDRRAQQDLSSLELGTRNPWKLKNDLEWSREST